MKIFNNVRAYENLHICLWLIKDTSWCQTWRPLGMFMIIPTLAVQLHITWQRRKDIHEVFHNIAVACWIAANAIWMTGEFYYEDTWRTYAQWLFGAGLVAVAFYYAVHFRKELKR